MVFIQRALDGLGDAACWGSVTSLLVSLFPDKTARIVSMSEMMFGLGYAVSIEENVINCSNFDYIMKTFIVRRLDLQSVHSSMKLVAFYCLLKS